MDFFSSPVDWSNGYHAVLVLLFALLMITLIVGAELVRRAEEEKSLDQLAERMRRALDGMSSHQGKSKPKGEVNKSWEKTVRTVESELKEACASLSRKNRFNDIRGVKIDFLKMAFEIVGLAISNKALSYNDVKSANNENIRYYALVALAHFAAIDKTSSKGNSVYLNSVEKSEALRLKRKAVLQRMAYLGLIRLKKSVSPGRIDTSMTRWEQVQFWMGDYRKNTFGISYE